MPNNAQNAVTEEFKGMAMDPEDAITNIAGLLNAGMFLMNTKCHRSVGIELINIAHDYACEVSKGGSHA
ncbi:hypothetical protein [Pectobacterium odoriferum]|uniref:hypothetical protein n=1 Tax=Pectobacterium odoriferum TaxID=78398 RepID=UPI00052AF41D|nr:hypothetical protein [Pectobacterium odoriferum]AIU88101.1 hypothetical protein BCS7_08100 [Pectobacterium odoriferum]POE20226.1 hypothetical protein BV918_00720 [Pectobacterium odoriferum]POE36946.1 hypothetical protein BV922_00720 [Pectobacterium odoriferum]